MKQQFIIEVEGAKLYDEEVGEGILSILLESRTAADALYADLGDALGYGMAVVAQAAPVPTAPRIAIHAEPDDMSTWSAEQLQAFFADNEDEEEETPVEPDPVPMDPDMAAAMEQVKSRRELQMADPANANSFQPHVAATVPPTEKRGSAIGAIRLNQEPEQAF